MIGWRICGCVLLCMGLLCRVFFLDSMVGRGGTAALAAGVGVFHVKQQVVCGQWAAGWGCAFARFAAVYDGGSLGSCFT